MRSEEARRVLGLGPAATPADIKAAYRQRVKAWHPDRFSDAHERAQAEAELKRIIAAYQCLHRIEREPEPAAPPSRDASDGSMFTIRPMASSPLDARHRSRRRETPAERRLRRQERVRRAAVLLACVAMVVLLARVVMSLWAFPWRNVAPLVPGGVDRSMSIAIHWMPPNLPFVEEHVTLGDRTACFSGLEADQSAVRACLTARVYERLSRMPVTTVLPGNTSQYRKVLCSALQAPFSQDAYQACVTEAFQESP